MNSPLEIIAVLSGLAYIILAAKLYRVCWIFGGISTLLYAYIFFLSKLYVESGLNAYYVVMAFVGWFGWGTKKTERPVASLTFPQLFFLVSILALLTVFLVYLTKTYTKTDYPWADAFIGSASVAATFLSTQKKIENWILWIMANCVAMVLFINNGLHLTAGLMGVYGLMAISGLINWQKKLQSKHA